MVQAHQNEPKTTRDADGAGAQSRGPHSPQVEAWFRANRPIDNASFKQLGTLPPTQRDAIVLALQQEYGNSFVQDGISGKLPESKDTKAPIDPYKRATWDYERCVELNPPNSQDLWKNLLGHMELASNRTPLYLAQMLASVPAAEQPGFVGFVRQHDPTLLAEAQRDSAQVEQADTIYDTAKKRDPNGYVWNQARSIDGKSGPNVVYQEEILERLEQDHQLVNASKSDLSLGQAMVTAEQDGVIAGPDVTQVAQNEGPLNELAITRDRIAPLQKTLDTANDRVTELDRLLATELAQFGPTLTLEQQAAYVTKFRQLNKYTEAQTAVTTAAAALDAELRKDSPTLQTLAKTASGTASRDRAKTSLADANLSLARSSRDGAIGALVWADSMLAQGAASVAELAQFNQIGTVAEQTLLARLAVDLKSLLEVPEKKEEPGATVREAILKIKESYVEPIVGIKHLKELQDVPRLVSTFSAFFKLSHGNIDEHVVEVVEDVFKEYAKVESFGGRLANIVFNGVAMTSISGGGLLAESAKEAFRKSAQDVVDMASELAREGKKLPANKTEYAALAKLFGARGAAFSRLLPTIGLTVSAAATVIDWNDFQTDKDPSDLVALVGDGICTLGALLEMDPVFAPLGMALNIVGESLDVVSMILPHKESDQLADENQILGPSTPKGDGGINAYSSALISIFTSVEGGENAKAAADGGMKPGEIQDLATRWPFLFTRTRAIGLLAEMKSFLEAGFSVRNERSLDVTHHRLTSVAGVSSPVPFYLFVEKSAPGLEDILSSIGLHNVTLQQTGNAVYHWLGGFVTGINSQPPQPGFGFDNIKSYTGPSIGPAT